MAPPIDVRRIGHATFATPDMARAEENYTNVLGLVVTEREQGAVYLACPGDYHSVVLRPGERGDCFRLSLQLSPDADLNAVEAALRAAGLNPERRRDSEPNLPDLVSVLDPAGIEVNLFRGRFPMRRDGARGIVPRKLGHTAFFVPDIQKSTAFYTEMLGFRVSDWIGDFFVFLRCGPDHHTVNFLGAPKRGMHHIAFELQDWNHVKTACDFLDKVEIPLVWGPGRHGPGHNIYTYHLNPDAITVEMFTDLDTMSDESAGFFDQRPWHRDVPLYPKVWPPGLRTTNFWGIPRPQAVAMTEGKQHS